MLSTHKQAKGIVFCQVCLEHGLHSRSKYLSRHALIDMYTGAFMILITTLLSHNKIIVFIEEII